MAFLETSGLCKSYGNKRAVDGLSLSAESGSVVGLLGANGAGKSSTLKMVAGLLKPDAGSIHIDGVQVDSPDHQAAMPIGFAPQEPALYLELTGRENLEFFGRIYGIRASDRHVRVTDVLEAVGLSGEADNPVNTWSGGMRRRLNLAIALLHQPRLLVLDEPMVGVDLEWRARLLAVIRQMSVAGAAVLYATHSLEDARDICDTIGVMDGGRLVAFGPLARHDDKGSDTAGPAIDQMLSMVQRREGVQ